MQSVAYTHCDVVPIQLPGGARCNVTANPYWAEPWSDGQDHRVTVSVVSLPA